MRWMQELEEDINTEHQVLQLAGPEIRIHDASEGTADFHSPKSDLGPPHRRRRTASSLCASSSSTDSEQKKQYTFQEAGKSTSHTRSPRSFDDQLLSPFPMTMASSYGSADSGYMPDGMTQSSQLSGEESSHWSSTANNGDMLIKKEVIDHVIDVITPFPQERPHNHHENQAKQEPSETLEADTIDLQESGCKCERRGGRSYIKNEIEVVQCETKQPSPANKDPGHSQQSLEAYNLKQIQRVYPPPTFAVASDDFKSESIVDMDLEKDLAKPKFQKLGNDIRTFKAEPGSVDTPSPTTAPLISINKEPSHPKYRNTLPLQFGHPKSRQWTEMLPSIKACTREIMGKGNGGALELFLVNGEPTICITCWDPLKLNLGLLSSCMRPLGLHINVTRGKIEKSASDQHDWPAIGTISDQGQCTRPSIHGHYMQRPTCGASLGTADGPLKGGKVSLGGYLKVKHLYRHHWSYYAMTVHHILVSDDQKASSLTIAGENEDEEMAEPGYDYSPGVCNGVYEVGEGPGARVALSCPAVPDAESLVARLEGRRIKRCASESYAAIDNLDNLDDLLDKMCTRESIMFGNAAWSSGLCLDQDVEVREVHFG